MKAAAWLVVVVLLPLHAAAAMTAETIVWRGARLAASAELAQVAKLQLDTFDPAPDPTEKKPTLLNSLFGGGGGSAASREARADRLTAELVERVSKGSDIIVVEGGDDATDSVLGSADLSEQEMLLPTHSLAEGLYLSSMAVDASSRRSGIGRALLRAAEDRAASRGATVIWLHVESGNSGARALYEQEGFTKQAESAQLASFTSALDLRQKEPLLLKKMLPAAAATTSRGGTPSMRLAARPRTRRTSRVVAMRASGDEPPKTFGMASPSPAPPAAQTTSAGEIRCELFLDDMPITASNFVALAESGFYDGLHFHRVIDGFMNQLGCPNSRDPSSPTAGTGGPAPASTFTNLRDGSTLTRSAGGCIPDEFTARITNDAGTLSMANTGTPDSGGSQLFMNVNDNGRLDWFSEGPSKHPVFGKCVDEASFNVMLAISQAPTQNDRPRTPIQIERSYVAAMVDPSSTDSPRGQTAAQAAAEEERRLRERAIAEQAAGEPPKAWWQQALGLAGNVAKAADEALKEADAKRSAEAQAANAAIKKPAGDPLSTFFKGRKEESLYDLLDAAIDKGDFEAAAKIKKELDGLQ